MEAEQAKREAEAPAAFAQAGQTPPSTAPAPAADGPQIPLTPETRQLLESIAQRNARIETLEGRKEGLTDPAEITALDRAIGHEKLMIDMDNEKLERVAKQARISELLKK